MVKIDSLCCCLNIYVNIRTKNLVKKTLSTQMKVEISDQKFERKNFIT